MAHAIMYAPGVIKVLKFQHLEEKPPHLLPRETDVVTNDLMFQVIEWTGL